jgi:isoquinoline 1-oxidoreductase beta subunit
MNPFEKLAARTVAASVSGAIQQLSRRDFLKTGGVFVIGVSLFGCGTGETPDAEQPASPGPQSPLVYVSLDADGTVRIISHRSEMGQGIRTGLPVVLADEMEADWERVVVEQATGDPKYGNQNTDGSHSVRDFMHLMREAGATMRRMLEQAAANQWGVDVAECRAELHRVVHGPSGRELDYGQLAAAAAELPVPGSEQLTFKRRDQFRYIGKELPIVDMHDMTHGTANYGADIRLPGMKFAVIARPPVVFGKVKSFNADQALAVPGVEQVVEIPAAEPPAVYKALGGLAVIATNSWAALKGQPGTVRRNEGNAEAALASAAQTVAAEYYAPHLAHAPMEPPAAVASVTPDFCEIWAPTQDPQTLIPMAKALTGLEPEQIRVNVTLLGGAFGRKSKCDFAEEAVFLSAQIGAPVLVQWSREDDIRHDYFHSVSAQRLEAGLDEGGKVAAWRHRLCYPTIMSTFDAAEREPAALELGLGAMNLPYAIPNLRLETGPIDSRVRIGWLRSVCNIFQSFAINSFSDARGHRAQAYRKPSVPDRPPAPRDRVGRPRGRLGAATAARPRARHRRAVQLSQLRGRRGRSGGPRGRQLERAARGHRDRLRHLRERRPGARAAGRRRHLRAEPGPAERDHRAERSDPAGQFQRLPRAALRRDTGNARAPGRQRSAPGGGGRAGRAADRARRGQRDLRRNRQAVPGAAAGYDAGPGR